MVRRPLIAERLVIIQGLLQGGLELDGDLAFQLGFQVVQQSPGCTSPVGLGRALYPHLTTKPPETKRYLIAWPGLSGFRSLFHNAGETSGLRFSAGGPARRLAAYADTGARVLQCARFRRRPTPFIRRIRIHPDTDALGMFVGARRALPGTETVVSHSKQEGGTLWPRSWAWA